MAPSQGGYFGPCCLPGLTSSHLPLLVPCLLPSFKGAGADLGPPCPFRCPLGCTPWASPRVQGCSCPLSFLPAPAAQYGSTKRNSMQRCLECLSPRLYYLQQCCAVPGALRGLKDAIQTEIVWHCLFLHILRERTNLVMTVFAPQIRDAPFCVHGG